MCMCYFGEAMVNVLFRGSSVSVLFRGSKGACVI